MGLFSNLFGDGGKDIDNALSKMKTLADDLAESQGQSGQAQPVSAPSQGTRISGGSSEEIISGPSGDSWGPNMPAEENQFNSGLPYQDYFYNVLNGAFASYQVDRQMVRNGKAAVFTFSQAGMKKLVVEVISDSSNPYKLMKDCHAQGIPYLRFYYDHDGWWNTKSYVTRRISKALGI